MDGIKALMELIYTNYVSIIAIVALGFGIYKKTKEFLSKSKEEQTQLLYTKSDKLIALIREGILDMVTTAEKEYGGNTGKIKKSAVYNMIVEKYPNIVTYIEEGVLTQEYVTDCIEDGVEVMNNIIHSNDALKKVLGIEQIEVIEDNTQN